MPENTVEAKLIGGFVDKLSAPLSQTKAVLQSTFSAMTSSAAGFASTLSAAVEKAMDALGDWGKQLRQQSDHTEGVFRRMGLAAVGLGLIVAREFYQIAKAVLGTLADIAKSSSTVLELRLAFDSLTQTMGVQSEKLFSDLKRSTEGLVSNVVLLRNANRVLAADIPITSTQYVLLAGNVFKLAKAAGQDGAQAVNVLTDALIKGNGRALASVGINLRVKDAISELAAASGQTANKLETESRMRVFVNELTATSTAAVRRNAAEYVSLADVLEKSARIYREEYLERLGEGIGRSAALAKTLGFLANRLDELGVKDQEVNKIARATNSLVITIVRGAAQVIDVITALGPFLAALWAGLKALGSAVLVFFNGVLGYLVHFVGRVVELFGLIPGAAGEPFRRIVPAVTALRDQLWKWAEDAHKAFAASFDQFGSNIAALEIFSDDLKGLANDLDRYKHSVVEAGRGDQEKGVHTRELAAAQRRLNEQLELTDRYYKNLRFRAGVAKENEKYLQRQDAALLQSIIDEIARSSAAAPLATDPGLGQQDAGRDIAGETKADQLKRWEEWKRIEDALARNAERSTPDWLKPYRDLWAEMNRLNELNMSPFHATLEHFRQSLVRIGQEANAAWGSFWADLVSGQEGAGKKFLASLINIIANEILLLSTKYAGMAVVSAILLDFAGAARYAAAAAALGALGGTIKGLAGRMAGTAGAATSAGASYQANSPRPYAGQQVQVMQVGVPGRAQSAGDAAAAPAKTIHEVVIRPPKGWVAEEVKRDVRGNGQLRTLIQAQAY